MPNIEIKQLSDEEKEAMGIPQVPYNALEWSNWTCEPSEFEWHYDQTEEAYIFQGHVIVTVDNQQYEIKEGDFVRFAKDLDCHWDVKEKVVKVYRFID